MKKSKFHNKKVTFDGLNFDSMAEKARYIELKTLFQGGKIKNLVHHEKIPLTINGHPIGYYEADFTYLSDDLCDKVYEDVKGMKTDVYQLKKKILAANGIVITEILTGRAKKDADEKALRKLARVRRVRR